MKHFLKIFFTYHDFVINYHECSHYHECLHYHETCFWQSWTINHLRATEHACNLLWRKVSSQLHLTRTRALINLLLSGILTCFKEDLPWCLINYGWLITYMSSSSCDIQITQWESESAGERVTFLTIVLIATESDKLHV